MHPRSIRTAVGAVVCGLALLAATASSAFAQPTNQQAGLINVNLEDVILEAPVAVAVPIGVALNVCGVNLLAVQQGDNTCDAVSNSQALSLAFANAVLGTGGGPGGGGGGGGQAGLVNVNVEDVIVQIPVAVAVPIGIAANVCGVNVLSLQQGDNTCDAEATSRALSAAFARALLDANP